MTYLANKMLELCFNALNIDKNGGASRYPKQKV